MPRGKYSYDEYDDGYDDYNASDYDAPGGGGGGRSTEYVETDIERVYEGCLVMARYSEDGHFYKARVESIGMDRSGQTSYYVTYVRPTFPPFALFSSWHALHTAIL
ncbi:tudor domain-containing protein [bacterium]|nr:tudor domain-containing protein [bacterium]